MLPDFNKVEVEAPCIVMQYCGTRCTPLSGSWLAGIVTTSWSTTRHDRPGPHLVLAQLPGDETVSIKVVKYFQKINNHGHAAYIDLLFRMEPSAAAINLLSFNAAPQYRMKFETSESCHAFQIGLYRVLYSLDPGGIKPHGWVHQIVRGTLHSACVMGTALGCGPTDVNTNDRCDGEVAAANVNDIDLNAAFLCNGMIDSADGSPQNLTPLQSAVWHDQRDLILWLVTKGAHLRQVHSKYGTLLHIATGFGRTASQSVTLKVLVELLENDLNPVARIQLLVAPCPVEPSPRRRGTETQSGTEQPTELTPLESALQHPDRYIAAELTAILAPCSGSCINRRGAQGERFALAVGWHSLGAFPVSTNATVHSWA